MNLDFKLNSLYICVKDMNRAIKFYETIFNKIVSEKDDTLSIFNLDGFHFCLFEFSNVKEEVTYSDSCLPSFEVNDIELAHDLLKSLDAEIIFPITQIKNNYVLEFKDCEGNSIEVYSRIKQI